MNTQEYIDIEVDGGFLIGAVELTWGIEDNSFDHEFGTYEDVGVDLIGIEDMDDVLFYPEDMDGKGFKMTKDYRDKLENILLNSYSEHLDAPQLSDFEEI